MQVKIKRIDKTLPMPEYKTDGAVAFDLYSRTKETIEPNEFKLVPTNLIVEIPEGYMVISVLRIGNIDRSIDAVSSASPRKQIHDIVNYK